MSDFDPRNVPELVQMRLDATAAAVQQAAAERFAAALEQQQKLLLLLAIPVEPLMKATAALVARLEEEG